MNEPRAFTSGDPPPAMRFGPTDYIGIPPGTARTPAFRDILDRALSTPAALDDVDTRDIAITAFRMTEKLGKEAITPDEAARLRARVAGFDAVLTTLGEQVEALDAEVAGLLAKPGKSYDFLKMEEGLWAIATAVGAVLFQALENPESITNIRTYAIAVGVAAIRAGIGAAMSLRKKPVETVPVGTPTPPAG